MRGAMEMEDVPACSLSESHEGGKAPDFCAIWRSPMPGAAGKIRLKFFNRLILSVFRAKLLKIRGVDIIHHFRQPYILAANHSVKYEALLLPAVVNHLRGGYPVHFMADWNFRLWPVVGHIMKVGESITVDRKPARPDFLNVLRPFFTDRIPPMEKALQYLEGGEPVGIFPEGTANGDPSRMLRGDRGAAWLALRANVPVLPAGIRFPGARPAGRIEEFAPLEIEFGRPVFPDAALRGRASDLDAVKQFHGKMMLEISRLCRKTWNPQSQRQRKKHESDQSPWSPSQPRHGHAVPGGRPERHAGDLPR